jgi:hypothetical protein
VNKNLVTIGCTEAEKVRFAAHLLEGPAASWWENYQITHPIEEVNWDMFQEAFRTAHISSGVMSLKKREFHNFRQGHRIVAEYIDEFNKLARYVPDDVDTDAKRRERFLDGLNDELAVQLSVVYAPNYQALIDKATILENKQNQMEIARGNFTTMGSSTQDHLRRLATFMMTVVALDSINMGTITITHTVEMDTTIMKEMATMATTTMEAAMAMEMEAIMGGTATPISLHGTSARCSASTARSWDTVQMIAQRQRTTGTPMGASQTHFRRAM